MSEDRIYTVEEASALDLADVLDLHRTYVSPCHSSGCQVIAPGQSI